MINGARVDKRRARLIEICMALPEVTMRDGEHIKFDVRGKTVATTSTTTTATASSPSAARRRRANTPA